ncbi:MAG: FMN-binding protein [Clostridia bacterium]|nr:FMN-binding protein [Clostridia bacterium]
MKKILSKVEPIINKITSLYKKIGDVATPTIVLSIICVVVTLALSSTNMLTENKIKALAIKKQNEAMAKLIAADEYHELKANTTLGDVTYNAAIKDGDTIGCIFVTEANGYGGTISVMTAVNMDCKIIAVEILAASDETPGLGQNVTKPDWYSQFSGLKDDITVIKGGSANTENNEINAVTGATISSKAVTSAVNQALDYAAEIIVKGDKIK